jgi:hypothetical protein
MKTEEVIKHYSDLMNDFLNNVDFKNYTYDIIDNSHFENETSKNVSDFQRIYWEEILQRAHWASITSIVRNQKWLNAIELSIQNNNFLSFTSTLRSLIESSGDNLLSLDNVALTLAENSKNISTALSGKVEDKKLIVNKELEEKLIHFSFGRKVSKEEKEANGNLPKSHNAKPAFEYIKKLDFGEDKGPLSKLYTELCQYTHPAAQSTHFLFDYKVENNIHNFNYSEKTDAEHIGNLLIEYKNEIIDTLQYGFNPSLMILKVLNRFEFKKVHTKKADEINLKNIKMWEKIETLI